MCGTGLRIGSLVSWTQLVDPWTQLLKTTKIDYICKESINKGYFGGVKTPGGLWRQAPYFESQQCAICEGNK
jgi:hypothetical protein